MGWQVIFSTRSRDDLRKIVERITLDSPAAAERFGMELIAKAESFTDAPHIGVSLRERPGPIFSLSAFISSSTARMRRGRR